MLNPCHAARSLPRSATTAPRVLLPECSRKTRAGVQPPCLGHRDPECMLQPKAAWVANKLGPRWKSVTDWQNKTHFLAPNSLFGDFWRLGPQPAQAKNHEKRAVCKPTHGPSKLPHYQKSITTNIVGKDFCPVNGLLGLGAAP